MQTQWNGDRKAPLLASRLEPDPGLVDGSYHGSLDAHQYSHKLQHLECLGITGKALRTVGI